MTYSPALGAVLNAGSNQTLTVSAAATTDYNAASDSVTIAVAKATLTVTANATTKVYGAANPMFGDTITGFVHNDPSSVVNGAASLTTTATTSSVVGSYPITAAQGNLSAANYTFTFVNNTLTVTKDGTTGVVVSSLNPSTPGQSVTFTVTVAAIAPGSGTPTGTVTFYDGSTGRSAPEPSRSAAAAIKQPHDCHTQFGNP